jgi:hypothetical protein
MKYLLLVASLLTANAAFAQTPAPVDRWSPWLGCWQVSEESVEDAERLLSALTGTSAASPARNGARVCVTASPGGGATLATLVNGNAVHTETIVADGRPRPVSESSCQGTQQAEWSQHGPRIYARTEITCGNQPRRIVSGFSAVVSGPVWVDIQLIESEGRKSMRVRRYRPAADQTGAALRAVRTMPLAGKLSLAEIKEASGKLAPEAVQAAVMELGSGGYDLNARRLIELDEAGVDDSVIDLMVAMSFPKKFVVERAGGGGGGSYMGGSPFDFDYSDAFGYGMPWNYYAHPMYYSNYYSPFGYYRWGYYDPYSYGNPGIVIINPGGGSGDLPTSGTGRVVNGQGYTRIRPNVPEPAVNAGKGTGWGGASTAGSSGSSGSNSGGSVSTGGYSGGGGGERVAVPRPPGGN